MSRVYTAGSAGQRHGQPLDYSRFDQMGLPYVGRIDPESPAAARANARKVAEVGYGLFDLSNLTQTHFGRTYEEILSKRVSGEFQITFREFLPGVTPASRSVYIEWVEFYYMDRREIPKFISRIKPEPEPVVQPEQVSPTVTTPVKSQGKQSVIEFVNGVRVDA